MSNHGPTSIARAAASFSARNLECLHRQSCQTKVDSRQACHDEQKRSGTSDIADKHGAGTKRDTPRHCRRLHLLRKSVNYRFYPLICKTQRYDDDMAFETRKMRKVVTVEMKDQTITRIGLISVISF